MIKRSSALVVALSMALLTIGPAMADEFIEPAHDGTTRYGTVEVVDQGQVPLYTLRYDWTVGESWAVRFTITRAETVEIDGQPMARWATSPFLIDTDVTVTRAFDDGTYEVVTEIVATGLADASSPDADASALATSLETLVGLTIRERFDDRGNRTEASVSDPIGDGTEQHPARDSVPDIMEHMVLQLPAEPIGVGGTWEVVTNLADESGLEIVGSSRHTVTAVDPAGTFLVETADTADQTVLPQSIDGSTILPGAQVMVDIIEEHGESVSRLDPTTPLPAYEGGWSMALQMGLDAEGRSFEYASTAATKLTIDPEGVPSPSAS